MDCRKTVFWRETLYGEGGVAGARPVHRAAALAVIPNPYAGKNVADLEPLYDLGAALAERLMPELVALLGGPAVSYGKAAIVGVNGEMEHGAAVLHPKLGKPMRAAVGGARRSSPPTSRSRPRARRSMSHSTTRTTSGRSTSWTR